MQKKFDGYMYKTVIMIGSVTTIVKRLMGKQIQKKQSRYKCVSYVFLMSGIQLFIIKTKN